MIELDGVVLLIALAVWLYALFDAITSDAGDIRNLGKVFWIVIILAIFPIGAILWFIAGRPTVARAGGLPYKGNVGGAGRSSAPPPPRHVRGGPIAPDDDPEFLQSLRKSNTEHEGMLGSWEADLRRREEELRREQRRPEGGEGPTA